MQELTDIELLRRYADCECQEAFAILVSRYVNLVHSTALRAAGNPQAAEEIAQAVFIILAQRASRLGRHPFVGGWLYQTTRWTAANYLRNEVRRVRREQEASMLSQSKDSEPDPWPQFAPFLEDAMGRLGEKERDAILLRFFQQRSFQEIGATLGGTENAAKKRVNRGLEKLRVFFAKRGVVSTATTIALALSANSVQAAPVALAKTLTAAAVVKGAAASGSTLTLVTGTLKMMTWAKLKTAAAASVVMLMAATTTTVILAQNKPVTVVVSGTVREKSSGKPIANALVRAHLAVWIYQGADMFERCPSKETQTDAQGKYRISLVTPLTRSGPMKGKDGLCVSASAPGFETFPRYSRGGVTPRDCTFSKFDFELTEGKRVHGVLVDAAGQPVSEATVRVQNGLNGDWNFFGSLGRTVTGEDGSFELWVGAGAEYLGDNPWLCILKPGAGSLVVWDILAKEDLGNLTLKPGGELTGTVLGLDGKPVANHEVSVRAYPWGLIGKALTDPEGKYHFKGVPGEASLQSFYQRKNRNYSPELAQVEVHASQPGLSIESAPGYKIRVKEGQSVTGASLTVTGADLTGNKKPSAEERDPEEQGKPFPAQYIIAAAAVITVVPLGIWITRRRGVSKPGSRM